MLPTVKNEFKTEPSVSSDSEDEDKFPAEEIVTTAAKMTDLTDNKYFIVTIRHIDFGLPVERRVFMAARVILIYKKGKITLISSMGSSSRTTIEKLKCVGKNREVLYMIGEQNKSLVVAFDFEVPVAYEILYKMIAQDIETGQNCTSLISEKARMQFQCIFRVFFEGALDIQHVNRDDVMVIDNTLLNEVVNSG